MCLFLCKSSGDPRVHEANIVWTGPDATSWVRNSCKTLKGEVAIEVVVEKDAVRRNGDAWRTVIDACLPVMHLINTRRSIPYGIQQLQELLGISCAFDQTVQVCFNSIIFDENTVYLHGTGNQDNLDRFSELLIK